MMVQVRTTVQNQTLAPLRETADFQPKQSSATRVHEDNDDVATLMSTTPPTTPNHHYLHGCYYGRVHNNTTHHGNESRYN